MDMGITTSLRTSFDDAVARIRDTLQEQGFGILTEIDLQATVKAKLGEDMERYLILGACNPALAHRAVSANKQIGLLLPCDVVVRQDLADPGRIVVEAMNPRLLAEMAQDEEFFGVAAEAEARLRAAIAAL